MHMDYAFDNHIYSFSSMTTYAFPVWQTYFFPSFMPITFEIIHKCVSIQNTNAHEVLNDSHNISHLYATVFLQICYLLKILHLAVKLMFLLPWGLYCNS